MFYPDKKNKTIDVVVSTVGGFAKGSVAETSTADIYKQYKLNFEKKIICRRHGFCE